MTAHPVALADGVRRLDGGRLLVGGSPPRLLRLTPAGAAVVARWAAGGAVGERPAERTLARRLLDGGVLVPRPAASSRASMTVVVPVRDRPAELARCLAAVRGAGPVIVVDDGSVDPAAVRAAAAGARVLRHPAARGAAAARNTGAAAATTPAVAFVDSDVVASAGALRTLAAHLDDPAVAAVAPRVRALGPARGWVAGYEARHSPLDMGPRSGPVGPGRAVPYVPSAVLVVRRDDLGAGFDPALAIGEDVDLVWRLAARGRSVVYAAGVEVHHDHRIGLRAFLARRRTYATSIGPLARRHPGALPAARVRPASCVPWALAIAGRPAAAVAFATADAARSGRRAARLPGTPAGVVAGLAVRGTGLTALALAQAVRRAWAPLLVAPALRGSAPARRALAASFALAVAQDAARARHSCAGDVVLRCADEVVALAGTWEGCLRHRTAGPLLPARWRPPR